LILLKNGTVFAPDELGVRDILIAGDKIVAIEEEITPPRWNFVETIDIKGLWVFPGLIDSHMHFAGAGGEGGPASRTPELSIKEILSGGITTAIGCLGTDGITRSVASVLMKAKGLRQQGMSAWMYTGSYQVPPPTVTGSISKDIALLEEVIGVGEIAVADHRSSYPSSDDFISIIQEAKVGGLLGGKAGIVNIHLGENGEPFQLIKQAVDRGGIHFHQFLPTHCNRSRRVFDEAKIYAKEGYIDLTTSSYPYYPDIEVKPSEAFFELLDAGIPLEHITFSTDSGGSLPLFDAGGNFVKTANGSPASLLREVLDIIKKDETQAAGAVQIATSNVADILKLETKGRIKPGRDADLLVLNRERSGIQHVFARGCHTDKFVSRAIAISE
jgi:beta-aspartyl-dipeptidase (metallo-type)